jgi:hypothetical protein
MGIFSATVCLAFFLLVLFDFSQRLPNKRRTGFRRWLFKWGCKGLLIPLLAWTFLNAGIFDSMPPLIPRFYYEIVAGHRFQVLCDAMAIGILVIGSYWAAVTSGWLLATLGGQTEHRREFNHCVLLWSAFLGPMAWMLTSSFGWQFSGVAVTLWFLPILQRVLSLQPEQTLKPIYSQALAKLNLDKHKEAEQAVLEELEKCEDDFDGWLFLADLYANHFHDLAGAEEIIHQTCDHPGTTASQAAVAFHRLADWHLKLGNDPMAARRILHEICRRHPKSHLDHMARLRIDHLPAGKAEYIESRTPKAISLPTRSGSIHEHSESADTALARAKNCIGELKKNPNDMAAREELARIYASELNLVDPALEQLELLLAMPDAPAHKAARWLSLMAAWHVKYKKDAATARKLFERVMASHPNTPEAFAARGQIGLMDAEGKMRGLR